MVDAVEDLRVISKMDWRTEVTYRHVKYLIDMYLYLTSQKMIRLISDLKSVFQIPPYYVDPDQMIDLKRIHNKIAKRYPDIYSNQAKVGKVTWQLDLSHYPAKNKILYRRDYL